MVGYEEAESNTVAFSNGSSKISISYLIKIFFLKSNFVNFIIFF